MGHKTKQNQTKPITRFASMNPRFYTYLRDAKLTWYSRIATLQADLKLIKKWVNIFLTINF